MQFAKICKSAAVIVLIIIVAASFTFLCVKRLVCFGYATVIVVLFAVFFFKKYVTLMMHMAKNKICISSISSLEIASPFNILLLG